MWINPLGLTLLNKLGRAAHISYATQRMLGDFISLHIQENRALCRIKTNYNHTFFGRQK